MTNTLNRDYFNSIQLQKQNVQIDKPRLQNSNKVYCRKTPEMTPLYFNLRV